MVRRSATSIAILGSRCSNSMLKASLPFTLTVIAPRIRSIVSMSGSLPSVPYGSIARATTSSRVRLCTSCRSVCSRRVVFSMAICGTRFDGIRSGATRMRVEDR